MARGDAALQRGDLVQAEEAYRAAIGAGPGLSPAYSNLANLLTRTGRPEEAVATARRGAELATSKKEAASAWVNLGVALQATRDDRGAYEAFLAAREADAATSHLAAGSAIALGDLEMAATCARDSPAGALTLARLGYEVETDDDFANFEMLHRAGSFDEAWAAISAANRALVTDETTEDAALAMAEAVVSSFPHRMVFRQAKIAPVLVLGPTRSGTTLLSAALSRHSGITLRTSSLINDALAHYGPGPFLRRNQTVLGPLREKYLADVDTKYLLDANHENVWWLGAAHALFDGALKVIVLDRRRDALAFSNFKTHFSRGRREWTSHPPALFARLDAIRRLSRHWLQTTDALEVKFEDLVRNPTDTITTVLQFLDLPPEPACFDPANAPDAFHTPAAIELRRSRSPLEPVEPNDWPEYAPRLARLVSTT